MSFLTSFAKAESKDLHDKAIRVGATLAPTITSNAQLIQWNDHAKELAEIASKAGREARVAADAVTTLQSNITRFTAVATKLAETNATAAEEAADKALGFQAQMESATKEAADTMSWANESRVNAEKAQKMVTEGQTKLDEAVRNQARAVEQQHQADARLAERERAAGLTSGLSSMDAALDAMTANANAARDKADAANLRANMLGKSSSNDDAINAALEEIDHGAAPKTLAEKMAALQKK